MDEREIVKVRIEAERAKALYAFGHITREEAEEKIQPFIDLANKRGKELAKEHGTTFKPISVIGFLR